jgi:type IV pilus assembly protein PilY1
MTATHFLWERTGGDDPDLGHVLQAPVVGMLAGTAKWVVIVGNGEESESKRAKLLVLDLQTGAVVRTIDTGTGSTADPNGLSGVRPIFNDHRQIVGVYAGDLHGNVWKFNLSHSNANEWTIEYEGKPMFRAKAADDKRQPIVAAPVHLGHPAGGSIVVLGTGKLSMSEDAGNMGTQTIYGIWDRPATSSSPQTPITGRTQLVQQSHIETVKVSSDGAELEYFKTSQHPVDWAVKRGWFLDLTAAPGQRVIYQLSALFGKVLVDTVYMKNADEQCLSRTSGGINYLLEPVTGAMPSKAILDLNADGVFGEADFPVSAYKAAGDGVNATIVARGRGAKIVSTGSKARSVASTYPARRAWRQIRTPWQ